MATSRRRKAFGQHFLKDTRVIQKIIDQTKHELLSPHIDQLVEIGPGKGAITNPLLDLVFNHQNKNFKFVVIEKDKKIVDEWFKKTKDLNNINIISNDFLHVQESEYLGANQTLIVSNLPYSSGTAILNKLALQHKKIPSMILMFQAEVAARLRATPNTKAWGSLSLWTQNLWAVEKILSVPPSAFSPPPEVNSEIVILTARDKPLVLASQKHPDLWEKLLKISFLHRRKMLRSSLPKDSVWMRALSLTQIDPTLRAEALTWENWAQWLDCVIQIESTLKS